MAVAIPGPVSFLSQNDSADFCGSTQTGPHSMSPKPTGRLAVPEGSSARYDHGMDLVHRGTRDARRVALLPAAWNPPTLAHLAIAQAALDFADEVLLVLPRVLPHKRFERVKLYRSSLIAAKI